MIKFKEKIVTLIAVFTMIFTIVNIASCKKGHGGVCDRCRTDSDCQEGLTCKGFSNSNIILLACASSTTQTCP